MDLFFIKNNPTKQLISIKEIVLFVLAVMLLLSTLFPYQLLRQKISEQENYTVVNKDYLQNLVKIYPYDQKLRLALIEQEVGLGEFDAAQANIAVLKGIISSNRALLPISASVKLCKSSTQQELDWQEYILEKTKVHAIPLGSSSRTAALEDLKIKITELATNSNKICSTLTDQKLLLLAQDSLAINQPTLAMAIYNNLLVNNKVIKGTWLISAAQTALSMGDYVVSAQFYLMALQDTNDIGQQRIYYLNALKALIAGNYASQALAIADKYYNSRFANQSMLLYLVELALLADQPKRAEYYLTQLIWYKQNSAEIGVLDITRQSKDH